MSYWLHLDTDPPVALYRDPAALEHIDCDLRYPALISLGTLRRTLSRPNFATAQTANLSVRLDNASGDLSREFSNPPLLTVARVMDNDVEVFAGVITDVDLSASASLSIEAGSRQPLADAIPLRSSSVWGSFSSPASLPHVYGGVTLSPIQYSQDRMLWCLCDHAAQGVDKVTRDDVETSAWAFQNATDSTGHAVALLELAEPLADGERLAVTLRGKMQPATGALLSRPDEILWDVLNLCGMGLAITDFDAFRTETDGISIAGVIDGSQGSARQQIDQIMGSVGAAWTAAMPGYAIAWPPTVSSSDALATADALTASDLTPTASHQSIATVLRVLFDYDWSTGKHRQALQIEAPAAVAQYGRIEREIDAGWLHTARQADQLARRLLAWMARPTWDVSWAGDISDPLPPGGWVAMDHATSPISDTHRLIQADIDMDRGRIALAITAPAGAVPELSAAALASAFDPLIQTGAAVVYQDGIATFTLQNDVGSPIGGATVTLDGGAQRISDSAGRVQFSTGRGRHLLMIEADGYNGMQIEVVL